ncbi:winged helix-turn-helix domain-containing protein [Verrucosispora sioxanthis]|nr:helix-turn-helix domain-containing protein [Verrucosispora sioxanthis]
MLPGMTDPRQERRVSDPADLKAVAHPLRVRLLAALREHGPATATELARLLDTESGSTSYHLRVLARHGFVTESALGRRHPRERRWAAVHLTTGWSNTELSASDAGRQAAAMMRRRQVEVLVGDVEHFEAHLDDLDPEWVEAAGIGDVVTRLSRSSVAELWDRFYAHLDELRARDEADPTAVTVSIVVAGFPRTERR